MTESFIIRASRPIGEKGKRYSFNGIVLRDEMKTDGHDTPYGEPCYKLDIMTLKGDFVTFWGSGHLGRCRRGDHVQFSAEIKRHYIEDGTNKTRIKYPRNVERVPY